MWLFVDGGEYKSPMFRVVALLKIVPRLEQSTRCPEIMWKK